MAYHTIAYFAVFLPIVILLYQVFPKKIRFAVILAADIVFFWLFSGKLIIYLVCASLITYFIGLWLEKIALNPGGLSNKLVTKKKRRVLALGILLNLAVLVVLKYTNFFGQTLSDILNIFKVDWTYKPIRFMIPIGLSFYTLEIISYLTDVYRGTQKAEHNFAKVALYLSFFPQTMEGPIARFHETADALYSGESIKFDNLKFGYQRILWGLFKKIVVADRTYPTIKYIFGNYANLDGSIALFGAICYVTQLYMEFSGCMDIVIGSGQIFGITLPENFRQPFLAKNAGDFWRRWHITLGTFFKDYIFYPVSLAKPVKNFAKKVKKRCGRNVSKFVAPTAALFCVWLSNGLWHGANWTFIFYGMYYFVLIFIENILEEPLKKLTEKLHINMESVGFRIFRAIKLFIIVVTGELFFNAASLKDGFKMFGRIFTDFHISKLTSSIFQLKMDRYDIPVVAVGIILVTIVGALKEKNIEIRRKVSGWVIPARWVFWYAAIMLVIIFGAYGSGYTAVDLIYAGY